MLLAAIISMSFANLALVALLCFQMERSRKIELRLLDRTLEAGGHRTVFELGESITEEPEAEKTLKRAPIISRTQFKPPSHFHDIPQAK